MKHQNFFAIYETSESFVLPFFVKSKSILKKGILFSYPILLFISVRWFITLEKVDFWLINEYKFIVQLLMLTFF